MVQELFAPADTQGVPICNPGTLDQPISEEEFRSALRKVRNLCATGVDGVPGELLKYSADAIGNELTHILNEALSSGCDIGLGSGLLIPLPKPGKPPGPLAHLRPVVLLNATCKCLSLVVLARIAPNVDAFLSPNQSGFRKGRSTSDVVWCKRWLAAKAQRFNWQCHILGLDMYRAFDTISREKLLQVMSTIVHRDELRMIQMLMHNTTLAVKVGTQLAPGFKTTIGCPQGDSLSPVLFTCYLEAALKELRSRVNTIRSADFPKETAYADDVDVINTNRIHLEKVLEISTEWDLKVNTAKMEWTQLILAEYPN